MDGGGRARSRTPGRNQFESGRIHQFAVERRMSDVSHGSVKPVPLGKHRGCNSLLNHHFGHEDEAVESRPCHG